MMQKNNIPRSNLLIKGMRKNCFWLIAFIVAFTAFAYSMGQGGKNLLLTEEAIHQLYLISLLLLIILLPAGYLIHKKGIEKTDPEMTLNQKLIRYRKYFTLKIVFIGIAAFFPGVIIFLGGPQFIVFVVLIVLIVILLQCPTQSMITGELNLKEDERKQLSN